MKETLYRKVGSRYKPVKEYDSEFLDSLPYGCHLVFSEPSHKIIKYSINPAYAGVMSVIQKHRDVIVKSLREWSEPRPSRKLNKKEQKAWEELRLSLGEEPDFRMTRESAQGMIDALEKTICEEI